MFNKLKNEKGFTLVELLLVILVIGILFTIVVPRIGNVTNKADETALKADFSKFEHGIKMLVEESKANGMTIKDLNRLVPDAAYQFNETAISGTGDAAIYESKIANKWDYKYKISLKNFDQSSGSITLQAFKGDTANDIYTLNYFYKAGVTDSCTTGFQGDERELSKTIATVTACTAKTAAF